MQQNVNEKVGTRSDFLEYLKKLTGAEVWSAPIVNLEEGECGTVIAIKHANEYEQLFYFKQPIIHHPKIEIISSPREFIKIANDAIAMDQMIYKSDDPKTLRFGFIVVKGSGATQYYCALSKMRQYLFEFEMVQQYFFKVD